MKYKDFEDYLQETHAQEYHGLDDDMPDAFDSWLAGLDIEEIMLYADKYAIEKCIESVKKLHDDLIKEIKQK